MALFVVRLFVFTALPIRNGVNLISCDSIFISQNFTTRNNALIFPCHKSRERFSALRY
ncbi:Uncharacterised protein [Vibrio cholerae]|nr:Uncharacterised protein [Vibrio cholerae]